jgi:hypothetical protein
MMNADLRARAGQVALACALLALAAPPCGAAQPAGTNIGSVLPPERPGTATGAAPAPTAKASEAAGAARATAIAPQGNTGTTTLKSRVPERSSTGR